MSRMDRAHCTRCGRIPPQRCSTPTAGDGPAPSGLNSVPSTVAFRSALGKLTLVAQPDRVMMALVNRIRLFSRDFEPAPGTRFQAPASAHDATRLLLVCWDGMLGRWYAVFAIHAIRNGGGGG